MNKYGSNYYIRVNLNMLMWHYNYLIFDLYHYFIFTCQYIHDYALNIANIHSFYIYFTLQLNMEQSSLFCFHSSTKQKTK
jgi:hypothetical protein